MNTKKKNSVFRDQKMKELKISAISQGTVIDHIPPKKVFKIAEILSLSVHDSILSLASNLKSKKMGMKGIIKVGKKYLTKKEFDKIALLAPSATVSMIKDYNVRKKFSLSLPSKVVGIMECNNPKCITNQEPVNTKFDLINKNPVKVRCHYCERIMEEEELKII